MKKTIVLALALALGVTCVATAGLLPAEPGDLIGSTGIFGTMIRLDTTDGSSLGLFPLGAFGPVAELALGPDGLIYGSTGAGQGALITIDPTTGEETNVGNYFAGQAVVGMAFVGDTLWGSLFDGQGGGSPPPEDFTIVTVDVDTGVVSEVGPPGVQIFGMAYDETTDTLYGVSDRSLYIIDRMTGVANLVGSTGFLDLRAITFGPDGTLYAGAASSNTGPPEGANGHLLTIDTGDGAGASIGTVQEPIAGLVFVPDGVSVLEVPTLGTASAALLALLLATASMVWLRRRRAF